MGASAGTQVEVARHRGLNPVPSRLSVVGRQGHFCQPCWSPKLLLKTTQTGGSNPRIGQVVPTASFYSSRNEPSYSIPRDGAMSQTGELGCPGACLARLCGVSP